MTCGPWLLRNGTYVGEDVPHGWSKDLPITPEKIRKALREKQAVAESD